jgi:hypothetical protein
MLWLHQEENGRYIETTVKLDDLVPEGSLGKKTRCGN